MCHRTTRATEDLEAGSEEARSHFLEEARRFGGVFFVCVAVWLLTGAGYFWPMWVLLFGGLKLGRLARHAYTSSSADDALDAPISS